MDLATVIGTLLGFGLEIGEHKFRLTNLFIHDTLKRASLEQGVDFQDDDEEIVQDTSLGKEPSVTMRV